MSDDTFDPARRFGGMARLYGAAGLTRFAQAHVLVVGIGGVGSWVAEALARSGIGRLTLIDLDHVAESNTNRQIHALDGNFGKAKVSAMAERITAINPACQVRLIDDFVTPDNVAELLIGRYDFVIDCIDQVRAKVALLVYCRQQGIAVVTSGSAGGKIDASQIRLDDLSKTIQDPLLAKVRQRLRKEYGYARDGKKMGVMAVYSSEPVKYPEICVVDEAVVTVANLVDDMAGQSTGNLVVSPPTAPASAGTTPDPSAGLNCAGFGSAMHVTATFGLFAVSYCLQSLAAPAKKQSHEKVAVSVSAT